MTARLPGIPSSGHRHGSRVRRAGLSLLAAAGLVAGLGVVPAQADDGASAAPAASAEAAERYVALGDSMASGPLIPNITGPVGCGRSTNNYGHVLSRSLGVDAYTDMTCSGAKTDEMTQPQDTEVAGIPAGTNPPQFDGLRSDTTLVTLTIGGNDIGLVGIAENCIQLDPTGTPCKGEFEPQVAQKLAALGPKLDAVIEGIHQRAPQARVLVTGYGLYIKPGGCWPTQPVLPSDADWLQGAVDRMNAKIRESATAHGAEYVDVRAPSTGHDACQSSSAKWVEGYVPTSLAAPLHPNKAGEAAYAGVIQSRL